MNTVGALCRVGLVSGRAGLVVVVPVCVGVLDGGNRKPP
jgi:hypothetical protein